MIGILGGSFDPIHHGHLAIGRFVFDSLKLSELRFLPCGQHAFAKPLRASKEHRLGMLLAAIEGERGFTIDFRELERSGQSLTIESLREMRDEVGADEPLCFVLGVDAFVEFDRWHEWQAILDVCHLVVMQRPDYNMQLSAPLQAFLDNHLSNDINELTNSPAGKILLLDNPLHDDSSTQVREALTNHSNIVEFVPKKVADYIDAHGLYQ
tara:strand:- start:84842 stop:85471 length:630 start_codon:yes stop_codon:yes gene_type:complete